MKIAKRIFLFMAVNILIITTISIVTSVLGLSPALEKNGINFTSLIVFCALWGFGGAFISLLISRKMAKWMMGVQLIQANSANDEERWLFSKVEELSRRSQLPKMPEVGIYESPDLNAFATGPSKSRSLVAVSTGLLQRMNKQEIEGVLAHEVAHIANGDMVTMTLIQGVVNAFVMFLARIAGWFAGQFVDEDKRTIVQFGVIIAAEILLGILGMLVVSAFSRAREFRADAGGASLAGTSAMVAALEALKQNMNIPENQTQQNEPAIASLKISGKSNGFLRLFSTHPDLDDRISKLKSSSRALI
jgi:heat shock protein HtpX